MQKHGRRMRRMRSRIKMRRKSCNDILEAGDFRWAGEGKKRKKSKERKKGRRGKTGRTRK